MLRSVFLFIYLFIKKKKAPEGALEVLRVNDMLSHIWLRAEFERCI
jgi:hypothetical protein